MKFHRLVRRLGRGSALVGLLGGMGLLAAIAAPAVLACDAGVTVTQGCSGWTAKVPVTVAFSGDVTVEVDWAITGTTGSWTKSYNSTDDPAVGTVLWIDSGLSATATGTVTVTVNGASASGTLSGVQDCATPTTTTTQVKDASGDVNSSPAVSSGDTVWDTATVTFTVEDEANTSESGPTVTYRFFDNAYCSSPTASTDPVTFTSGAWPISTTETLTAGSYSFDAVYSGDSNYTGSTSSCEPFSVKAPLGLTTHLSAISAVSPASVTDTATLSGVGPTAIAPITISVFSGSGSEVCTGTPFTSKSGSTTLSLGNRVYAATFTGLGVGSYEFQATSGTVKSECGSELFTVSSPPVTPTITPTITPLLSTTTTTAASLGGPLTTSVTDFATVAPVTGSTVPAGTVTFDLYDTANCSDTPVFGTVAETLSGGTATSSPGFAPLAAGTYYWTASYLPAAGSGFAASSSLCGASGESVTIALPAAGAVSAAHTTPGAVSAAHTTPTPTGAVLAVSTPVTGADLFLPGLSAAFAFLFGGLLLLAGVRLRRRPTV